MFSSANLRTTEALQRHGIDYETLHAINRRLIYVSISGYGRSGPRAGQPGYDLVSQAESGTVALTGEVDGAPMRFPTPIADMTCGLFTVIGILAALRTRDRSGSRPVHRYVLARGADDLAGQSRRRVFCHG